MLRTLRHRLILSHVLPVLLVLPVIGIALIYVLETNILLPVLANELTGQAQLIARLSDGSPSLWQNPTEAQAFVNSIQSQSLPRIELINADGLLLASNVSTDADRLGQPLAHPALPEALQGQQSVRTTYSRFMQTEIADVLYPVKAADGRVLGVIRLSHQLASVQDLFLQVRYLIISILAFGLGVGVLVGLLLALNMERPLRQVTLAVYNLTRGDLTAVRIEHGPEEIRLLLHAVNSLVERLRGLEEARRQLLANLVHELGRSLGAVHSAIWALLGRSGDKKSTRQELLTGVERAVVHLERLLDDLAQLHGQVLGTLELNRQPVDLNTWLPQLLVSWQQAAVAKGLQWQVTLPADLPVVNADADRLAQVVGNLVSNAIKYTLESGAVQITAGQKNGQLWICVADTGPGISAEEQAHIFEPLYRGKRGSRFPQGMGLGLNIARDLVVAHGGQIQVESEVDRGSRFTVWLPL